VYKTGVSFSNMQFSIYKQASHLTNWHLGLQLSFLFFLFLFDYTSKPSGL